MGRRVAEAVKALVSLMLRAVGFAVNLRFLRAELALLLLPDLPLVFAAALPDFAAALPDFAAALPDADLAAEDFAAALLLGLAAVCPGAGSGIAIASAQTTTS